MQGVLSKECTQGSGKFISGDAFGRMINFRINTNNTKELIQTIQKNLYKQATMVSWQFIKIVIVIQAWVERCS